MPVYTHKLFRRHTRRSTEGAGDWKSRNGKKPSGNRRIFLSNGWDDYQQDKVSVMAIAGSFEIKNTSTLAEEDLNGHILKTNTEQLYAIADSGSPMSFLNEKTARCIQQYDKKALFKTNRTADTARNLACYNGERIIPKGRLIITIESGGWKIYSAPFIVVDDKKQIL